MSNEEKAKVTHIMMLAKTALADGKLDDAEVALLALIAKREGFSEKEFKDILEGRKSPSKYTIPESDDVKIQYLKDMAVMMMADGDMNEEEMKLCLAVGMKLGLPKDKISEILTEIIVTSVENKAKNDVQNKCGQEQKANPDEQNIAIDKMTGLQVTVVPNPEQKTPRPPFSDDEASAMGTLAISIVRSKINQPEALMSFAMEYEGYSAGFVERILANVESDFMESFSIFAKITDPLKKSYAAGFFASIIKACGVAEDDYTKTAWRNFVNEFLHLGGEAAKGIEEAARWYECFEHGKPK